MDDLTELCFKLWVKYNKEYKRNMEENKFGLINKEFVKKHLQRETELENKIIELENKLKNTNIANNFNDDMCQSLLKKIAICMTIEMHNSDEYFNYGLGGNSIKSYPYMMPTISVNSVAISEPELMYLRSLIDDVSSNIKNNMLYNRYNSFKDEYVNRI